MLISTDILESMRRVLIQFLNLIDDCLIQAGALKCRTILPAEERRLEQRRREREQTK